IACVNATMKSRIRRLVRRIRLPGLTAFQTAIAQPSNGWRVLSVRPMCRKTLLASLRMFRRLLVMRRALVHRHSGLAGLTRLQVLCALFNVGDLGRIGAHGDAL